MGKGWADIMLYCRNKVMCGFTVVFTIIMLCCTMTASFGSPVELAAKSAVIHGIVARYEVLQGVGNICYWTDQADWLEWKFNIEKPGEYIVELKYSCAPSFEGSTFEVTTGDQHLNGKIGTHTGAWSYYDTMQLGTLNLDHIGTYILSLKPTSKPGGAVMNLVWLRLIPEAEYKGKTDPNDDLKGSVYIVPNFHPASSGWLTDFSTERNYCLNTYLDHLDRVRDDPNYAFDLSEVVHLISMINFEPQRVPELKQRIKEGRVELANGFFNEPTINLSGGEALVKEGVEGIRWQREMMGVKPRFAWMIDVIGVNEQMPQIVSGLGLDALVYCRYNPTGSALHWALAPDGTKTLAISSPAYSDWWPVFGSDKPVGNDDLRELAGDVRDKLTVTQPGLPVFVLGGAGDYSTAPKYKGYPSEFLKQWGEFLPGMKLKFATAGNYLDAVMPDIKSGKVKLPVMRGGTIFAPSGSWTAFWIQNPTVKKWFRQCEAEIQAGEASAAIASLTGNYTYPVQDFYHAWLLMCLNMDRNTLWGAAGGMVFDHPKSWAAKDRFEWIDQTTADNNRTALQTIFGKGQSIGLFNPLNWKRSDPSVLQLPQGRSLKGMVCQNTADGKVLCSPVVPSVGVKSMELSTKAPVNPKQIELPDTIETDFYSIRIDPNTGALVSLRTKPSRHEMLAGPVDIVAEKGTGSGDFAEYRPYRKRLASVKDIKPTISVTTGPLATIVDVRSEFYGGKECRRVMTLYKKHPRIDFDVELSDIPDATVVVTEFPLAGEIREVRRGIPYGFSVASWPNPDPKMPGCATGIVPAVRWSHYTTADGYGFAILDRGLSGRELNGNTPVIFLMNACDKYDGYDCAWLSGKGTQKLSFALVANEGGFPKSNVVRMGYEFNAPILATTGSAVNTPHSFVKTSDNMIVEAIRREGQFIEIRMVESKGLPGTAKVALSLPHTDAAITNMLGENPIKLRGNSSYTFKVRPQQIVTMRFKTKAGVKKIKPLTDWNPMVPVAKRDMLNKRLPNVLGHPPLGW